MLVTPLGEVIREFAPNTNKTATNVGRIVVRTANHGSKLDRFDTLFNVMANDALQFEPPVQIDRAEVEVVHFSGEHYKRTFGLEFVVPAGVRVANNYTLIERLEDLL